MNFVYNINSVFCADGSKIRFVNNISYIVNAVVARSVKLYYVKNVAAVYPFAYFTFTAWIAVNGMKAVYGFCKYFCAGGFARAS